MRGTLLLVATGNLTSPSRISYHHPLRIKPIHAINDLFLTILMWDQETITSWINCVDWPRTKDKRAQPSLLTPPLSSGSGFTTCQKDWLHVKATCKRRRLSSMASYIGDPEATPRKRRGRVNNLPTRSGSSISDASSHQRFSQPASPARSLSPVKDLLNELRFAVPRIDYQASHESAVPATVDTLIQKLAQGLGESCIPIDLKVSQQSFCRN